MKTLLPAITDLKNDLAVSGAWLTLMDICYPTSDAVLYRYVNDTYNLAYPDTGLTYSAAAFQVQQITEEVQMSLPKITIIIYDPELNLKDDLQAYNGMSGGTVVLRRVYKATGIAGAVTDVGIRQDFTILDVSMEDTVISLSVGIADPLGRRFPRDNYGALTCRHKFGGGFCRYDGNLVKNPSFEDGPKSTPAYWVEKKVFQARDVVYEQSTNQKKFGSYSLHTRSENHNTGSKQTFAVTPNTQYTFSCWIYLTNYLISSSSIRVQTLGMDGMYRPSYAEKTLPNQWQQVSVTITTAAAQTEVTIYLLGRGDAYFDMAMFVPTTPTRCTHTLEDAPDGSPGCRSHNNSAQYGGSPGAAEGIFYDRRQ